MPEPDNGDSWRIDELAQRSQTSVDTIRFYQREGLLPPARRQGRASVYGPVHLRSLEIIHDLQAKHFSLGAIKAITQEGRLDLVEAIFATGDRSLDRDQLVIESGLDPELVTELEEAGLLSTDPASGDHASYDTLDLRTLQAVRGMLELGMPRRMVVLLARTYVGHVSAMQREVLSFFTTEEGDVPGETSLASEARAMRDIDQLMPLVESLLENVHRRAVQRITLQLMDSAGQRGEATAGS